MSVFGLYVAPTCAIITQFRGYSQSTYIIPGFPVADMSHVE